MRRSTGCPCVSRRSAPLRSASPISGAAHCARVFTSACLASTHLQPPYYSFQSTNFPGNWISPVANGKLQFLPGLGTYAGILVPNDATWLAVPAVANAPANFSFQTQSINPAYAGRYLSKSAFNSNPCVYTSPAGDGNTTLAPVTPASTMVITPVVLAATTVPGTPYYLSAVDATTGALLWSYAPTASGGPCPVTPTPALGSNGLIYVGSGRGMNALTTALPQPSTVAWNYPTGGAVCSSAALAGNVVFFGSSDGYVYAVLGNSGLLVWRYQTGGAVHSSPALSSSTGTSGAVFVGSMDGKVYALDVAVGSLIWSSAPTGAPVWSSPAYVVPPLPGVPAVWVGGGSALLALSAASGAVLLSVPTGGSVVASPAAGAGGLVAVGSTDGKLYTANSTTLAAGWSLTLLGASPLLASPAVDAANRLYVNSAAGVMSAVSPAGVLLWNASAPLDGATPAPGVPAGSPIILPNGNVYAVTGPRAVAYSPVLVSGYAAGGVDAWPGAGFNAPGSRAASGPGPSTAQVPRVLWTQFANGNGFAVAGDGADVVYSLAQNSLPPMGSIVSILPSGPRVLGFGIRHCNYVLSFSPDVAGNNDFRHFLIPAINGLPPPYYSIQ